RVLARNPGARWTGIDGSEAMVAHARGRLPAADLRVQRLEDALPEGPFDLVVSCLAVHHLDGEGKRDLFRRIAQVSDTFVLGDVVVPERPEDAVIEIDWVEDLPSTVPEQLAWLRRRDSRHRPTTSGRTLRSSSHAVRDDREREARDPRVLHLLREVQTPAAVTTKSVAKPSMIPVRTSQVTRRVWPYLRLTA